MYCVNVLSKDVKMQADKVYPLFKTTVDDISKGCHIVEWYSLSLKTTVDDIEWSDCGRVDCVM